MVYLLTHFPLQARIYDWDSDGSHDLIGEFYTTLGEFTQAAQANKKVMRVTSSSTKTRYKVSLHFTVRMACHQSLKASQEEELQELWDLLLGVYHCMHSL